MALTQAEANQRYQAFRRGWLEGVKASDHLPGAGVSDVSHDLDNTIPDYKRGYELGFAQHRNAMEHQFRRLQGKMGQKPGPKKEDYPSSHRVKAGLRPLGDLPPWKHVTDVKLDDSVLRLWGEELEDPMALSEGHRKSLNSCRRLWDDVMRLKKIAIAGWDSVRCLSITNLHKASEKAADTILEEI